MLTPSHIAASYLISQTPKLFGNGISSEDILLVMLSGNIIDLDFLIGAIFKKSGDEHHKFTTHTPIFSILLWIISTIVFNNYINKTTSILILAAMILHLIMDDLGYWLCKMRLQKVSEYSQINWLYPFKISNINTIKQTNKSLLKNYFRHAKVSVFIELLIISSAIIVALYQIL